MLQILFDFFFKIHDITASSESEDNKDGEDDGDVYDAAIEDELKECLLGDEEAYAPMLETGDEDWGSGSHQTEPSTADDDEDTAGRNYEKVR